MKCSEHDFLSIRKKSCLELDDGQFIVKVGLINNLNYLLDFLKQEQNKISDDSYMDVDSNLTFDLINKNPLLKNLVLWYQRIGSEGVTNTDKNGGKLAYEFIRLNILGSLPAYGIDNTATVNDILKRWWYIFNQCLQRNIRIIDSAAGEKLANSSTPTSFYSKIKITLVLFFLREQQLSLFFQDATHLATKWRNRLLSSTAELRLGDQSISIDHLYSIIDNAKFTKIDHGLRKSDINPKDCQNFSSCVKLTSDDPFKILKDNVDTQGTLIYLQILKMIITAYVDKKNNDCCA
ncbi:unnamed protein product, partial [Rotaria magnacalcarata]